jgi:hypothetical protein
MKPLFFPILSAVLLAGPVLHAQNPDPLVYTVGKTFVTGAGATRHNFLVWQPGDVATTFGKRFAVYSKNGGVDAPGPYALLGIQTVQTSPSAIQALLVLGAQFDADAATVPPRVATMFHDAKSTLDLIPDPLPQQIDLQIAQQLAQLLAVAKADPKILERLFMLGRAHPGVLMTMGHGFAIETGPASLVTYEVREIDGANQDVQVIGRVTLDAANPQALVAPGRPHPVPHPVDPALQLNASAKDHLSVRLRWATPDPLRALFPHSFGFNLYRVQEATAEALGWHLSPPATADLVALVEASAGQPDPAAARVNMLPVTGATPLTEIEAADVTPPAGDNTTFFFGDDKNPPERPFHDGETVYYYVAARDIAGHPGPVSPGTRVVICDRLPPDQPKIEAVLNTFAAPATAVDLADYKGLQHLTVRIRQVPEDPPQNSAKRYYVYRWAGPRDWMEMGGNPTLNLIGSVAHAPGQTFVDFHDNTPGPNTPLAYDSNHPLMGKTIWYTVRAEDDSACTPKNLSGHSAPGFGVLRDRVGPPKPGGNLELCVNTPLTIYTENSEPARKDLYGLPDHFTGLVVRFQRESKAIKSFEVELRASSLNGGGLLFSATRAFKGGGAFLDQVVPSAPGAGLLLRVRCRTGAGRTSNWQAVPVDVSAEHEKTLSRHLFIGDVRRDCEQIGDSGGNTPPPHEVVGPNGEITGVIGGIVLPPGSREWRVYRRVGGDGDFELIARGAGSALPPAEAWEDDAPTIVNGTTICYYGQVFDEHANSSPFTRIGCLTIKNGNLPTPLLSDPEPLPPAGDQPLVRLKWFCDPVGVDRFEVWAALEGGGDPGLEGPDLSPLLATAGNTVLSDAAGEELVFSLYQTAKVGSAFGGNGAEFSLETLMPADKRVYFAVRAVGAGAVSDPDPAKVRAAGDFSNVVSDLWQAPPEPNQPVVPWPARKLATVQSLGLEVADYQTGEGPFYAAAVPPAFGASAAILVGAFPAVNQGKETSYEGSFPPAPEPLEWLFKFRRQTIQPPAFGEPEALYPFVVYRHQVPNAVYPEAVPNLVQVTPLIDRISYKFQPGGAAADSNLARDPFFIFRGYAESGQGGPLPVPLSGKFDRDPGNFTTGIPPAGNNLRPPYLRDRDHTMWVKDPVAVAKGATYQYLIVRFTERGEIDRVLPTNLVEHQP